MFFTATQFLVVIKGFHSSLGRFQAIAMLFFVLAQYLIYKYVIRDELKRKRYMIINSGKRMKA
jgi:hypothetical protein